MVEGVVVLFIGGSIIGEKGGGLEVDMGGGLVVLFIGGSREGEEGGGLC